MSVVMRFAICLVVTVCWAPIAIAQNNNTTSGTGFFINSAGWLVTNAHVVNGCTSIEIRGYGTADLVVVDDDNDVAVVHVTARGLTPFLPFRHAPPRLGEEVITLGFPLAGLLSDSVKLTTGNISSLAGINNDENFLQVSAPIQPGNSGGPLVDLTGHIVGVMASTLSKKVSEIIGYNTQNVNFAVTSSVIIGFLKKENVSFEVGQVNKPLNSVADVVENTEKSTVHILCLNKNPDAQSSANSGGTSGNKESDKNRQKEDIDNINDNKKVDWTFSSPEYNNFEFCQIDSSEGLAIRLHNNGSFQIALLNSNPYFNYLLPRNAEFKVIFQADLLYTYMTTISFIRDVGYYTIYTISDNKFLSSMQKARNLYIVVTNDTRRMLIRSINDADLKVSLFGSRVAINKLRKCFRNESRRNLRESARPKSRNNKPRFADDPRFLRD